MAKVTTFISTKGSVGKTTLIIHIAGYLASKGKKVLLIDADSQQSLSGYFNYLHDYPDKAKNGFCDFLAHDMQHNDVIYKTANHNNIDIIVNDDPDNLRVSGFLKKISGAVFKLGSLVDQLRQNYDYIFIDTEGTDGRDHSGNSVQNAAILAHPDLVVSVTKSKLQYAMETVRVTDVYREAIKGYANIGQKNNSKLKFIVNEHDRGLAIADALLKELREGFQHNESLNQYELLETVIPYKKKFFESYYQTKEFAHEYHDTNKHDHINVVIKELCEELYPEVKGDR